MGFAKDVLKAGLSPGLALLAHKKKKDPTIPLQPTMISNRPYERPISMIGTQRGGY